MSSTLTVHIGDLHVGSTVALCPPTVRLDDGGTYAASDEQLWYWRCWRDFWQDTAALKARLHCRVLVVFGGDLRDGDHHHTTQLWAANEDDQDRAVYDTLDVARPVLDAAVFLRGTPAHCGPAASADERYARTEAGRGWPVWRDGELYSWWIWTGVIEGVRMQAKHAPGTVSRVPGKQDSGAARQAEYLWTEYAEASETPPQIAVYHHVHISARGFRRGTFCQYVPGWQLPTEFVLGKRHTPKVEPPGGMRFYVSGGDWRPCGLEFVPPKGAAWTKHELLRA